jgi:spermidine synthase
MKTYTETLYSDYGQTFTVDKVLFESTTGHQHLIIFENARFGRVMALDGVIQTTEADEFIYHEMLTHVPLMAHGNVKRVLIIGGGDGGMLREVCKHATVEHITQVEIDAQVIEMCREYLPGHSAGAYDDPRVNIVIDDGAKFVREYAKKNAAKFDVIISDCTDPIGPGDVLFTSDFYADCKNCLTNEGILVAQNGVAFMQPDEVSTTARRLKPYFADQTFYCAAIPTYIGGVMCYAWATPNRAYRSTTLETITQRFNAANILCRYYNPAIHLASFALPQYMHTALTAAANSQASSA